MAGYTLANRNAVTRTADYNSTPTALNHINFSTDREAKPKQAANHLPATLNPDNFCPITDPELVQLDSGRVTARGYHLTVAV